MKLIYLLPLIFLASCLTMTQKERGKVKEKFITNDRSGNPRYHVITEEGTFIVNDKEYAIIDTGEVYYDDEFHLDGTTHSYKSAEELYNN